MKEKMSLNTIGGMERGFVPLSSDTPTPWDDDWFTPQSVEEALKSIIGQDEAKQAASMIIYDLLQFQLPTTSLFIGETGCGKTEMWRCLSAEYPGLIQIADASNLSASGWKGDCHVADLLKQFDPNRSKWQGFRILVLDEFDKIWMHKNSDTNYFDVLQSQLLKLFEHDSSAFPNTYPTEFIAIVCCGAFSSIYEARHSKKGSIGFTSETEDEKPQKSLRDELSSYSMLPELIGRFDRIIEMNPPSLDVYQEIARRELHKLEADIHKEIIVDDDTLNEIASEALTAGLGARYIRKELFMRAEQAIYANCYCKTIQIGECLAPEM